MRYEFILKYKEGHQWYLKYNCNVEEQRFNETKKHYEDYIKSHKGVWLLLINELDDNNEFIQIVQ